MIATWVKRDTAQNQQDAQDAVDLAKEFGFTDLIYHVGSGIVTYRSNLLDHAAYVTDDYDPLATMVTLAHRAGLGLHAWLSGGPMKPIRTRVSYTTTMAARG